MRETDIERLLGIPPAEMTKPQAAKLCHALGPWAVLLLDPEVINKARNVANVVPRSDNWLAELFKPPGSCWVLAVPQGDCFPAFGEAVVFPLVWRKDRSEDDPWLPEGLKLVGEQVRSQFSSNGERWTLHFPDDLSPDRLPCSLLAGSYESAWVSLAGGLVLAMSQGLPEKSVWATGAWDPDKGISHVDGVEKKIRTASRFGAKQFFLPETNKGEAEQLAQELGVSVRALSSEGTLDPRKTIQPFLDCFERLADRNDSREKRCQSYRRIPDRKKKCDYYLECILPEVAHNCREKLRAELDRMPCDTLITVMSQSPTLMYLSHEVLRPKQSLILYDQKDPIIINAVNEFQNWLKNRCESPCVAKGIAFKTTQNVRELIEEFQGIVREHLDSTDGHGIVLDVTPGKKVMSLALVAAAPPGSRFLYMHHKLENNDLVPFKESPELFVLPRTLFE